MRNLAPLLVACLLTTLVLACARGGTAWPAVVKCAPQPGDVVAQVIADLEKDGPDGDLGSEAAAELKKLLDQYAPDVAACLVQAAIDSLSGQQPAAERSATSLAAEARGRVYLRDHGVKHAEPAK